MGGGASSGLAAAIKEASADDVKGALSGLSAEQRQKLSTALGSIGEGAAAAPAASGPVDATGRQQDVNLAATDKPQLIYWGIAGRGELARLIAAVGGIEMEEEAADVDDKASFGSPGSLPVLKHGSLKMAQSTAIENYLARLAPKFSGLTLAQRGRDSMCMSIKEDLVGGCAKILFTDLANAPTEVPKVIDKWFTVIEGLLPASGFINGLEFPTVADLAVLNVVKGYMPFGAAYKHSKYNWEPKYPKIKALAERTEAFDAVKKYLESTSSMGQAMGSL